MILEKSLLKDFAKITNDIPQTEADTFVYGSARNINGQVYVKFDGADIYTPVLSTIEVKDNDRVMVMIQNHTGTITSNVTSPAVGVTSFTEYKGAVADSFTEVQGKFDQIELSYIKTDVLEANYASINYLESNYIKAATIEATYAKIATLEADYIKADQINAEYAKITTLEAGYAKIDLTNIETGCIKTYMLGDGVVGTSEIADASITDAKIVGLTANKITAGTLNAGVIDVVNLNADNITAGSINGQRIGDGAIDYSKLSSNVSDDISDALNTAGKAVISTTDEYTLTDTTDPPTNSNTWSTDTPIKAEGQYVWRRVVTTYGNGTIVVGNPAMLTGNTGASGTKGNGIASSIVKYSIHTSGTDIPSSENWTEEIPNVPEGYYLWTRVTITYDDSTETVSYSVAKDGIDGQQGVQGVEGPKGDPGDDGVGILSVTKYYCLSATLPTKPTSIATLPPSGWSMAEPSYTNGINLSLYSTELIIFSDNSFSYSTPCLSSSYEASKEAYFESQVAKTTADLKNSVFYQVTAPNSTNCKEFDVWFDTSNDNKMYYWNGSAWTPRQFGTASFAEKCITASLVASNAITSDNIVAGTITSEKLNTTEIFSNSAVITEIFANDVTATGTITGAIIQSAGYTAGISPYSSSGMLIDLSAGKIEAVNFGITTAGNLYAKAGQIGGWTLSEHSMSSTLSGNYVFFGDGSTCGSGNQHLHVMLVRLPDGTLPFFVTNTGYLHASNVDIYGNITATVISARNIYSIHNASGIRKEALSAPDSSFGSSLAIGTGFDACYLHGHVITGTPLIVSEDGTGTIMCGDISSNGTITSSKDNAGFKAEVYGTQGATYIAKNGGREGQYVVSATYALGIYDVTNYSWVIKSEPNQDVVIPHNLQIGGGLTVPVVSTYSGYYRPVGSYNMKDGQYRRVSFFGARTSGVLTINATWGSTSESYSLRTITTSSSDIRLKENVKDCTVDGLRAINNIRIRQFDWIDSHKHQKIGMIADEIENIDENLTIGGGYEDGEMFVKSVDTFYLVGYLVKALQEEDRKVKNLESRVEQQQLMIQQLIDKLSS